MLAARSPPGGMTDNVAVAGIGTLGEQFKGARGRMQLKTIVEAAKKRGYTPNINDIYQSGIADGVGDPLAFVPSGAGYRGHIKKVCEMRGIAPIEADMKVNRQQYREEPKRIPLAENLIKKLTPQVLAQDPSLKRKKPQEIREAVIAKHGSRK
jgi:hypothetical protein